MTAAATLNSALTTNYALGVSSLVDADMNVASTACKLCRRSSSSAFSRCHRQPEQPADPQALQRLVDYSRRQPSR